jgi:predicted nuclease with TOPRIM domain
MRKTNREKIRREFQELKVKFEKINFKQVKLEFEKGTITEDEFIKKSRVVFTLKARFEKLLEKTKCLKYQSKAIKELYGSMRKYCIKSNIIDPWYKEIIKNLQVPFILGLALVARDQELVKFSKSFINGIKKVVV